LVFSAALSSQAQSCVLAPSGLVGWWSGDYLGGDELGSNPATLQNGTAIAGGKVGQGFSLDGIDDYISIGASPSLNVGSGDGFTLECWILPTDTTSPHIIAEWNNGASGIGVHLAHSIGALGGLGSLFANVKDATGGDHYFATGFGLLNTVSFQHVALTYDKTAGIAKIFHNGNPMVAQNLGIFLPQTSYPLYIGTRKSDGGSLYFGGIIDELSLYGHALSDSEIQTIYNAGISGKCKQTAPNIIEHPASRSVSRGATVVFQVFANGASPSFQWRFNDVDIGGGTNATLTLTGVQTNQAGNYSVALSNSFGFAISSNAVLTVYPTCVLPLPGLVSWWTGDGNALDGFNVNDGILHGGLEFTPGLVGQAFNFDGVNDYVSLTASSSLNVGTSNGFTFECWVKPNSVESPQFIAEWNGGGGAIGVHFMHSYAGSGALYANLVDVSGNNHIIASAPGLLSTGVFHHVAVTYDKTSGTANLFCDGMPVASVSMGGFAPQTGYPLYLGTRFSGSGTGSYLIGLLDEASLYNRALSAAEILSIFNAGSTGKYCLAPEVLTQPSDWTVKPGSLVTFLVAARGTLPLSYQWRRNNLDLDGATNTSMIVSNAQPANAGNYSVRITNTFGSVISSNATLKVNVITVQGNGQTLTNSVNSFSGPVTIQLLNSYTNGLIFYTLDGSTPWFFSSLYEGPFVVDQSVMLRALGYSADFFQAGESDPIAILIVPSYPLSVSTSGGGSVSRDPSLISYLSNTVVTLTTTPNPGWTFLQWLGDASGKSATTNITMIRPKSVQAIFGTTLSTTAAGGGSVVLNPPGGVYPFGATVQLSAIPQPGNFFGFWGNAGSGNVNPLIFVVTNANPTVSSLFASTAGGQSALTIVPIGMGRVSASPRGNFYPNGSEVTLTATPDAGQSFFGWSGDAIGVLNPLPLTLDASRLIYAHFTKRPHLAVLPPAAALQGEGVLLLISGSAGDRYQLESSTDLSVWTPVAELTNTFGTITTTDSGGTNSSWRFYRAVVLP
jgi:hypothetical protein